MADQTTQIYRDVCKKESIPLFMQAWWMDAVCGKDNWDVLLSINNDQVNGALPYSLSSKYGYRFILQPLLTQFNGVWVKYPSELTKDKKLSIDKEVMQDLIDQLDKLKVHYFNQNFHYSITNWQPFFWKGFNQTTRYTYIIDDLKDPEKIIDKFSSSKKNHLKKAQKIVHLEIGDDPKVFYDFHKRTFKERGKELELSEDVFQRIYFASKEKNGGEIFYAKDNEGNIHAAVFVVWNNESAYKLISAFDKKYRSSGSSTFLVAEIIKYLSDKTKKFDFEGSMIKSIAKTNQEYGGVQMPYFNVFKNNSSLLGVLMKLRKLLWKK